MVESVRQKKAVFKRRINHSHIYDIPIHTKLNKSVHSKWNNRIQREKTRTNTQYSIAKLNEIENTDKWKIVKINKSLFEMPSINHRIALISSDTLTPFIEEKNNKTKHTMRIDINQRAVHEITPESNMTYLKIKLSTKLN